MNDQVEGIILKQLDYKDNSVILTVLTKEYGKISLVAGGVRKLTSKNAGSVMPYMKSLFTFDYKEGKTMFRLKTARTIHMYRKLHEDLNASSAAAMICEAIDTTMIDDINMFEIDTYFDLVEHSFNLLQEGKNSSLVLSLFFAELFRSMGIMPEVDQCVLCGKENAAAISIKDGGFICEDCATHLSYSFDSIALLKSFRLINKASLSQFEILEQMQLVCDQVLDKMVSFLDHHSGIHLRSYTFYQRFHTVDE